MNDAAQLKQMVQVTQALYHREQQSYRLLLEQENLLRSELRKLDGFLRDSHAADVSAQPLRGIGADVIWQGWVGRKKVELNMKLAQVLAMKEHHVARVRRAFGKVTVAQSLCDEARIAAERKTAQAGLARAVDHALFMKPQ